MDNGQKEREKFGSRLGFILISAGCAIGLGNIWKFPYIVSQYGGACFILIYLLFLVLLGLPLMTMEFAVGRASQKGIATSFSTLEPKGTKWHWWGAIGACGNYLLMMFYTVVTAWLFVYFYKMIAGEFVGQDVNNVTGQFDQLQKDVWLQILVTALVVALGFFICSLGLKKGLEKINKAMMICLLFIIVVVAVYVCTLPGAGKGIEFYLVPNIKNLLYDPKTGDFRLAEAIFAALAQAFFTLSIGMGSMTIFGSYIKKERSLLGEAVSIAALDTGVALIAGLIIVPAKEVFDVTGGDPAGPGLIFQTLPNVFNTIPGGRIWGTLFFLLMVFAAMSTVSAVFENIISFGMDKWGWSRKKSCIINGLLLLVLVLPCILGFNVFSDFHPFAEDKFIMDLEDFIISYNILPLGSLVYVLFCTTDKKGWGWDNFLAEANTGKGLKFSKKLKIYCKYIIPVILILVYVFGILSYLKIL